MAAPKKRSREQDDEAADRGEGSSGSSSKTSKKAAISQNGMRDSVSDGEDDDPAGLKGQNNKKMQRTATKSGQTAGNKQRSKATAPSAATMVKEAVRNKGKARETPAENGQQDNEDMEVDAQDQDDLDLQSTHNSSRETTRMQREIARLRVDNEQLKQAYRQIQKEADALVRARRTEPESLLEDLEAQAEERVAALQKAVETYNGETKALREENKALKAEIQRLDNIVQQRGPGEQAMQVDGQEEAEENEESRDGDATTMVPETQFADRTNFRPPTSSASTAPNGTQIQIRLEAQIGHLQNELAELQAERDEVKEKERASEKRRQAQVKAMQEQLDLQQKAHAEEKQKLEKDNADLQKIYDYEVRQSKALQQQSLQQSQSGAPPSSSAALPPDGLPVATELGLTPARALEAEKELSTLLADLMGASLIKRDPAKIATAQSTYIFLMSDGKKRRHLHFKINLLPETQEVAFIPDVQPGRDDEILKVLDKTLQSNIKFGREHMQPFFKKLWKSLNASSKGD